MTVATFDIVNQLVAGLHGYKENHKNFLGFFAHISRALPTLWAVKYPLIDLYRSIFYTPKHHVFVSTCRLQQHENRKMASVLTTSSDSVDIYPPLMFTPRSNEKLLTFIITNITLEQESW
jgi:hypothetical protein